MEYDGENSRAELERRKGRKSSSCESWTESDDIAPSPTDRQVGVDSQAAWSPSSGEGKIMRAGGLALIEPPAPLVVQGLRRGSPGFGLLVQELES